MIYFDNASTSFPKAPGVSLSIKNFIDKGCFNINRGLYLGARDISELVFETRELIKDFFSGTNGKNVIFTGSLTVSVNMALKGILKPGDNVLTSTMEHNAVMRPLKQLEKTGVEIEYIKCNNQGEADFEDFKEKIEKKPKMLMITHASNVCGTVMPITKMGELCQKNGVLFAVDSAQTAGAIKIDVIRDNIDILCFTGHKGLLSVQGIGGFVLSPKAAAVLEPLISGGTGSFSHLTEIPHLLPDRFEAGTLNLPGIVGLNNSIKYLNETGIDKIFKTQKDLQEYFEAGLEKINGIKKIGAGSKNRCAITSLLFTDNDIAEAAYRLDGEHGIMTRCGLHCAPAAIETLGVYPAGTLRFSFSHKNTYEEIDTALKALKNITG